MAYSVSVAVVARTSTSEGIPAPVERVSHFGIGRSRRVDRFKSSASEDSLPQSILRHASFAFEV